MYNNPQDDYYTREQARIEARRAANEARRQHFLNAKARLIGQDVEAIQRQIDEKKRRREEELQQKKLEEIHQIEIMKKMEEVEYEEQRRRKEYNKYLQQEWLNNIQEKNYYNSLPKPPDFNKDIAGKSALLQFDGEDLHKKEREQQQKNQMLKWIKEKVLENNIKKREEEIEEMNYNEMIKMVNEIRRQNEEEEEKIRRRLADEIRQENYYLGQTQRQRNQTQYLIFPDGNKPVALSLDLFNESKNLAISPDGRVTRVDAFKGFTKEQIDRINYENKLLTLEHLKKKQKEREEEYNWAIHQLQLLEEMERIARQEEYLRKMNNIDLKEDNRRKTIQDQYQRQAWTRDRYGRIDNHIGIYDGFGKSCR